LVLYILVRASDCFPNLEGQDTWEWANDSHKYSADVLFRKFHQRRVLCHSPHICEIWGWLSQRCLTITKL